MKIVFIVNTVGLTGGIKVILEHSNKFCQKGHEVSIVHLLYLKKGFIGYLVAILKKIKYFLLKLIKKDEITWFKLKNGIKLFHVLSLENIGEFDYIIATANETADWVAELDINKNKKFYFVQGYESWTRNIKEVDKTYTLPLKKIVISKKLFNYLSNKFKIKIEGIVPNGVNNYFLNKNKYFNSQVKTILMMYHVLEIKGIDIGLEAIRKIKKEYKNIEFVMFGTYKLEKSIPFLDQYFYKPKKEILVNLYKNSDIYIFPSLEEGFGITPMEAMASGNAVISTKVGAIPEYSKNKKNIYCVKTNNSEEIYLALKELINNNYLRKILSYEAIKAMENNTWENSNNIFEKILLK